MSLKYVWRERCVTSRGTLLNGCYEVGTTCKLIYVYTIMGGTQTWSTLVKIMAFRLFGTTPLNQPIMNLKKSMDPIQSSKYYILSFNDIHFCNICNKLTSILFSCKCVNSSFKVLALGWFSCETHCAWNAGICFVLFVATDTKQPFIKLHQESNHTLHPLCCVATWYCSYVITLP